MFIDCWKQKKQLSMKYVSWIKFHFLILIRNKKHEHKSVRIKFQFLQKDEYRWLILKLSSITSLMFQTAAKVKSRLTSFNFLKEYKRKKENKSMIWLIILLKWLIFKKKGIQRQKKINGLTMSMQLELLGNSFLIGEQAIRSSKANLFKKQNKKSN